MAKTYVIAGAGLAAVEAAAAFRKVDAESKLVMIGEESTPFYTRLRLPELVAGTLQPEKLVLKKPQWYEDRNIELRLSQRVDSVNAAEHTVSLINGEYLSFDGLLLATGARCFIPPFAGSQLDGVIAVRTVEDAQNLRERCLKGGPVVVIGGGLLGLEMAAAVATFTSDVSVVEIAPWLLVRQLDKEGGEIIQSILEEKGLKFHTGVSVSEVLGEGSARAVRLKNGTELEASTVLVSAGIRANVELAKSAGCEIAKGIVVNDQMATSVDGIYAAGDCCEHNGRMYGIWPAAEAQGKVAGAAMAGGEAKYSGTLPSNRLKVTGVDVFSTGDFDPNNELEAEVSRDKGVYRKLVRHDGQLVGAILIGDVRDQRALAREIAAGRGS